ncbi:hypothetical protein WMF26_06920 [Sorangium sp. So ce185]|uniref:hypothetical protein n=1 Tax=Sorangium sp. So ce185 TaxID=3133287 RepID=UPI003F625C7E
MSMCIKLVFIAAVVAGVGLVGCVAALDDETTAPQNESVEEIGEAKGALCTTNYYRVRWDHSGVRDLPRMDVTPFLVKDYWDPISGPRGGTDSYNGLEFTIVYVNSVPGYNYGYMRRASLDYQTCD